jgi:endonuclease YncB( thermonuclease family)
MARRFRRRRWWIVVLFAVLGSWVAIRIWYDAVWGGPRGMVDDPLPEGIYAVKGVIDAVTIVVSQKPPADAGGHDRPLAHRVEVRLIGVGPPDTGAAAPSADTWSQEACDCTRDLLPTGSAVRLRFDRVKLDDDGRWRAYVFVRGKMRDEELMLNEELVRRGLARAAREPGDSASLARRIAKAGADPPKP